MGLADSPEVELEIGRVGPQAPHAGWTRSWSASCDRGRLRGSGVRAQMVAGLGPAARLRDDLRSGDVGFDQAQRWATDRHWFVVSANASGAEGTDLRPITSPLAATTHAIPSICEAVSLWPSTSSPARAATAGSRLSRMPNTWAASRRRAIS